MPIQREIFNKMVFCEKIFQFIELEESLFFTSIDVNFHSEKAPLDDQDLLDMTYENFK
jgi:Zn-dependent oligopeptidase